MPVPHLGTLYLTVSRTLILLCKPSNAILRLSFFLHTSTFSAFEVSYKNALHKSTVIKCAARGSLELQDPKNRQKFAIWALEMRIEPNDEGSGSVRFGSGSVIKIFEFLRFGSKWS